MTYDVIAILVAAGFVGGMANAMAGGATLLTFPAMMAAGLAPIPANASNALAVVFGNLMGAWADRKKLPTFDSQLLATAAIAVLGGALGAGLLLWTPQSVFEILVPALIGAATFIFAFSKPIQAWVSTQVPAKGPVVRTALMLPATVYGGYFGAGLGVILLAVLGATGNWDLRTNNALKNVLGVLTNAAAIVIFIVQSVISWPATLTMMAACILGGYVGGRALHIIPPAAMRRAIIVVGCIMTLIYVWRYWL
jgi:uncharacterized protein